MSTESPMTGARIPHRPDEDLDRPAAAEDAGRNLGSAPASTTARSPTACRISRIGAAAAQRVKQYVVANLDKLLVEFERNISARGATVLWAKDAAEANQHVLRHCPASTASRAW